MSGQEKIKLAIKTLLGKHCCNVDPNQRYQYPDDWQRKRKYYGQYGEDAKIFPLFQGQSNGFFVEVGAMEGIRFSNTYLFERLGWQGICVEPHPRYFALLKKNRSRAILVSAAVGKEDKEKVNFYLNYRGSLSSLDNSLEKFFQTHYSQWFGGYSKIQVPMMTLNTLLSANHVPAGFDILSIDTEGTDWEVLVGFDIRYYAPRVIIVEISIRKERVHQYLETHGYILACTNPSNAIFCKNLTDARLVRLSAVVGFSASPRHPLD